MFGQVLVHSINKIHILVVTVEFIWLMLLNILSLNFVQTPIKSFRFKGFSRSYIKHLVVTPTTVKVALLFAWCTLFKYAMFHFYSCLKPILVDLRNLFLLSTPVTPRWVNRDQKCEIVIHIFISRLTILTRFSPSSHYIQEATFYTLIWFELNSISICLCKDPNVIFHSNGLVVY